MDHSSLLSVGEEFGCLDHQCDPGFHQDSSSQFYLHLCPRSFNAKIDSGYLYCEADGEDWEADFQMYLLDLHQFMAQRFSPTFIDPV